jgi:phosphatidylinositol dimannoside acyltransferase
MKATYSPRGRFAVHGVFWRNCIDWIVLRVPSFFHPILIFVSTLIFFFFAAPARRTALNHLAIVLPSSWRATNYFRAFRIFWNFGWALTDAAAYRLLRPQFAYELVGEKFLSELSAAKGGIVLTAHLGNYDLGAAIFAEKFQRELRIVRAPEPDAMSAQHLDRSLEESAAGAVKVEYNTEGTFLSFDLVNALRRGEIVSIQGDRAIGGISQSPVTLFGRTVLLPNGPFILALVSGVPLYPLFVVRAGYRRYKIVAGEPIACLRSGQSRDQDVAAAMAQWAGVLEKAIADWWPQWYAFTPVFDTNPVLPAQLKKTRANSTTRVALI